MSQSSPESSLLSSGSLSSAGSSSARSEELHLWNGAGTPSPPPSLQSHAGGTHGMRVGAADGGGGDAVDCGGVMRRSLNSMDCWDYSIELECLSGGPEGDAKRRWLLQKYSEWRENALHLNWEFSLLYAEYGHTFPDLHFPFERA